MGPQTTLTLRNRCRRNRFWRTRWVGFASLPTSTVLKTGFDMFCRWVPELEGATLSTSPGLYGLECDAVDTLRWYCAHDHPGDDGANRTKMLRRGRRSKILFPRCELAHVQGSELIRCGHSKLKADQAMDTDQVERTDLRSAPCRVS